MEAIEKQNRQAPPALTVVESDSDSNRSASEHERHHVPTHFAPQTGRWLTILILVLAAAFVVGFFVVHHHRAELEASLKSEKDSSNAEHPTVDVVRVKYSADSEALTMPGTTAGWYEATIYARVTGYVASWTADIGDRVKKDQVLARIDTPDLDARLMAAKAKLAAAQADVTVSESAVTLAKTTNARFQAAAPEGAVSQLERDEKKAEFDSSVAKLKAAQAQVHINEADVSNLEVFTTYKKVTAPFDGIITARRVDIGDLVTEGSTTATKPMYTVAQSDTLRVFVDVPQSASAGLKVGMPAVIQATMYPDRKFSGNIARTANSIDPDSRTLHVEVDIKNSDFALVPGMYVQVKFELIQTPLIDVPASALLFRSSGSQIAIVDDDGKIHFQEVTIVHDEGDIVEISAGVALGAKVALNLSNQIVEGEQVTASDISDPSPATKPMRAAQASLSQTK
jgi:RND family efflux transporter MFP subunit